MRAKSVRLTALTSVHSFERWVATPPTGDYYIEQSLSELPDGKYRLKAYIMTQQTAENGGPKGLFLVC